MNIAKKTGGGDKDYTWTNAAGVSWTLTFSESFEEGGKLTFMWATFDLFPLRNIHFQFNFVSFPCCGDVGSLGIYYITTHMSSGMMLVAIAHITMMDIQQRHWIYRYL